MLDTMDLDEDIDDQSKKEPSFAPSNGDKKKFKYGVLYFSYIPDGITVRILRDIMSELGEVGRIYLEPDPRNPTSKRRRYTEGWLEFKKKRVAKEVAAELDGTQIEYGKKHSTISGQTWSIKYLHRFKWSNLIDRLSDDKEARGAKRRREMSESRKQADFYQRMTERSRMMKKMREADGGDDDNKFDRLPANQKKPIVRGSELAVGVDEDFLGSIFKKVD